ncbi:MAG: EFR1 family ferrodoxin [Promethearchaeota archaeon]
MINKENTYNPLDKIGVFYFSATNNTAIMAKFISKQLKILQKNLFVDEIDITNYSKRHNKMDISQYDAIFFGFPVYAWRAPAVAREWLQTLDGNGKKCSVFFTYGGVKTGAAHYDITQLLEVQNFEVVSTAEYVCKHTYNCGGWGVMENRPNQSDFEIAEEYVRSTYNKFESNQNEKLQIDNPRISDRILKRLETSVKKIIKPPSRKGEDCSLCKKCEENCPTNAMDSNLGEANQYLCIRCYRCFINCPEKVLKIEDLYPAKLIIGSLERMPTEEDLVKSKIFL